MALGSRKAKEPTKQEIMLRAQELDDRRQEQIQNQVKIINRMRDEIMVYDAYLGKIASGFDGIPPKEQAQRGLDEVDKVRKQHREQNRENKNG